MEVVFGLRVSVVGVKLVRVVLEVSVRVGRSWWFGGSRCMGCFWFGIDVVFVLGWLFWLFDCMFWLFFLGWVKCCDFRYWF